MIVSSKHLQRELQDKPRAVFFDFDGTLAAGSASLELMNHLAEIKVFPEKQHAIILQTVDNYKNGKVSYDVLCFDVGRAWADGLKGKGEGVIRYHARQVFDKFIRNIYDSSFELVGLFAANSYTTIVVSSGAHEINSLAARALGVEELYCTELEVIGGAYTGRVKEDRSISEKKAEVLAAIRDRFDMGKSFAFGDSVTDEKVLGKVGIPVALNPSKELEALARKNKWKICTHENVVAEISNMINAK